MNVVYEDKMKVSAYHNNISFLTVYIHVHTTGRDWLLRVKQSDLSTWHQNVLTVRLATQMNTNSRVYRDINGGILVEATDCIS